MTERNLRVERQMQADYERHKPRPVVAEWMERQKLRDPIFVEAIVAFENGQPNDLNLILAEHRRTALASAKQGDFSELRGLVRNGTALNVEEQNFVADGIGQNVSKQRGAPKKAELSRRVTLAFFWLTEFDGCKREAAIADLMDRFGVARSTVNAKLKSGQDCILTQEKIGGYRLMRKLEYFDVINYFKDIDLKSE